MRKILLVEDHDMMRLFLSNFFGKEYEVTALADAPSAVSWIQNNTADLILADFPDKQDEGSIHGLSLLAGKRSIPLVILTDKDKSEQRIQAFRWGAKDSVSKPFNPVELQMRINCHLPAFSHLRTLSSVA